MLVIKVIKVTRTTKEQLVAPNFPPMSLIDVVPVGSTRAPSSSPHGIPAVEWMDSKLRSRMNAPSQFYASFVKRSYIP